ncbi:MAG: hypothetical protein R2852_10130 [Bacteroidia bacterium]
MLKKVLSISLVFLLMGQFGVQLGVMTYFSFMRSEIVLTKCENIDKPELECNGKCYLNKQLGGETESNKAETTFSEKDFPYFEIPELHVFKSYPIVRVMCSEDLNTDLSIGNQIKIDQPPEYFSI